VEVAIMKIKNSTLKDELLKKMRRINYWEQTHTIPSDEEIMYELSYKNTRYSSPI